MQWLSVTHETKNNTLEVTVLQETMDRVERVSCTSYSREQKADLIAAIGIDADKYILMAGW